MVGQLITKVGQKPESLKLIAWFLIITSAIILLSNIRGQMLSLVEGITEMNSGDENFFQELTNTILIAIWIAFYLILLVSSIHLLQLKLWALETVEILTWLYLVFTLLYITLTFFPVGNRFLEYFGSNPVGESGESIDDSFRTIILMMKGIGFAIAIVILLCLKGKTIRAAFLDSTSCST